MIIASTPQQKLVQDVLAQNAALQASIEASQVTDDRKQQYQATEIDTLVWWNNQMFYWYYALLVLLVLFLLYKQVEVTTVGAMTVGLAVYPFAIDYVLIQLYNVSMFLWQVSMGQVFTPI